MLKSSVEVALCLLPTGKKSEFFCEKLLISKQNRKRESAVKVVANGRHTAKLETESHLRRGERKRLALIAADV
jgi:hypothetical protein